jgi:hypothetical protein
MIIPSDIAFVISVIKNARHVWDQTIRKIGLGEPLGDGETEAKVQPIFTKGTGKKKEQGRSLWSDKGMKYFRCMEKVWKKVYKHKTMMVDLYRGFDKWTSMGAKSLYQKTRQSLCFQWWQCGHEDNDNSAETEEVETEEVEPDDESDEDKEEGYCSDTGNNTLSIILAREEKERTTRNSDGINNNNNKRRRMRAAVDSGKESDDNNDNDTTVLRGRQRKRDRVEH